MNQFAIRKVFTCFKRIISRQYIDSHKIGTMGPFSERMFSITIDLAKSPRPATTRTIKIPFNQLNRWLHTNVCSGIKIKSVKNNQSQKKASTNNHASSVPTSEARSLGKVDKVMSKKENKTHTEITSLGNQNSRQRSNTLQANNNEQAKKDGNDRNNNSKRNQRRSRRKATKNQ